MRRNTYSGLAALASSFKSCSTSLLNCFSDTSLLKQRTHMKNIILSPYISISSNDRPKVRFSFRHIKEVIFDSDITVIYVFVGNYC